MGTFSGPNNIADGLVFYIDPANPRSYLGTGTIIYDLITGGIAGTLTNGPIYNVAQKGGIIVDGANDYISISLLNLTNPITVSAWVKNVYDTGVVFGAYGTGVNYANAEYIFEYSGKTLIIQGNPGGFKTFQCPQLTLNQWCHLVMTRDSGNSMSVYVNGVGSTSNLQTYSNTLQVNQIGRYSNFTSQYNTQGVIGEVKIYNRALSATEVLQNYNATKKRYYPDENYVTNNLVLNFDFGNPACYSGTGNTAYDLSGFGHTASLVNGAVYSSLYGGSIFCDGTNDYIEAVTTSALDFGTNNFTVEYWYRKLEYTTGYDNIWGPNIWQSGNNSNTNEWSLSIGNGSAGFGESVSFVLQSPSNGVFYKTDFRVSGNLNRFNQVVGIRNGALLEMYFNGSLLYSENPGGGFSSSMPMNNVNNNLRISNSYLNQYYSKVHSGIVRIYNKALTATEINQNYQALLPRFSDASIITDGLILNYDFGSAETYPGTGTLAQNLVGTGYTGTLTNGPVYSILGGGSLTLDGVNDYISSADPGIAIPFTMSVWVYFNSLSGWQTIIGQDTSLAVPRGRFYFQRANLNSAPDNIIAGRINFTLTKSDGNVWVINSQANPTTSTWINYTIVISSSLMSLYQNGVLQDSLSGTFTLQTGTGNVTYGVGWYSDVLADYCNLNMGNVLIYNRALSDAEIAQNFNATRNKYGL